VYNLSHILVIRRPSLSCILYMIPNIKNVMNLACFIHVYNLRSTVDIRHVVEIRICHKLTDTYKKDHLPHHPDLYNNYILQKSR